MPNPSINRTASGSRLSQTLGIAGMPSRISMNVQCALSSRQSNTCTCQAGNSTQGRATSKQSLATLARAVRPASLAASAMPERLDAGTHSTFGAALEAEDKQVQHFQGRSASWPSVLLRSSARPNTKGCGGSRFGLLACVTAQRTMRAGCVPQSALPNHSINRTPNGESLLLAFAHAQPPLGAGYLKR